MFIKSSPGANIMSLHFGGKYLLQNIYPRIAAKICDS
jgi:hypothetical protein